jgi:hypothetical protein
MNRHMTDYAALPTDALGPPMRTEPEKPADGEWKPLRPGYVSRVLAGGAVEVKRTDLPVQPPKQEWQEPAEPIITPLAPSSAAPVEWQSGPPPSVGWFNAQDDYDRAHEIDGFARYWNGSAWGSSVTQIMGADVKITAACAEASLRHLGIDADIRWRGPRLVGDAWPEPQA